MNFPVCPCDDATPVVPTNPPQQSQINFRFGAYAEFRRAVLAPVAGEQSLSAWRTQGQGDLAVMMAEWFAYLGDILTFYDERIANQAYLRTADLDASVKRLIRILGYRPRPAIGATGVLAALVTPGQSAVLPRGLQIQSKPAPGQAPQTFELSADTAIGPPDQVLATTPPDPIGFGGPSASSGLLLQGAVTSIEPGAKLLLRPRDFALGDPLLAVVAQATVQPSPAGGQQTALALDIAATPPSPYAAAQAALERSNQSITLWNLYAGGAVADTVHLSSLARQIRPGAWVLFTGPGIEPLLTQVISTTDTIWDANSTPDPNHPLPIPHTVLVLSAGPPGGWPTNTGSITVMFDWISVGQLLDQPPRPWSGAPSALGAASATRFPTTNGAQVLLQDQSGVGAITTASSAGDFNVQLGSLPTPLTMQPPFEIMFNPLPVTRGKTVSKEVLGSGDPTRAGQSFSLAKSPVTYLEQGTTWASTIALTVNGEPWTEVPSFYGQVPNAQIFVTREDVAGQTHVDFGDGVNGARLPTGVNNIVATYRIGAGAASPPAGKLTVIAQSFPGLRSILNPVAVGGGADPDPPNQIRRYAPRSVLTFGRAVSVFDYEALAAQAPGVSRARAVWAWNNVRQRALVTVYVGDDAAASTSARAVLAAAGDPNRPVTVVQATPMTATLSLTLIIKPGWNSDSIKTQVTAALADPETGLFSADTLPIGQPVFDSQIEQAVLGVAGTIAIAAAAFTANGANDPGPLHNPGEGGYYALDASDINIVTSADSHGG
jgi:Baseplate J-like protein